MLVREIDVETIREIVSKTKPAKSAKPLRSIREVVEALGGNRGAAQFWRVTPSAVSNMLAGQHISSGHHSRTIVRLLMDGYDIDLKALNLDLIRDIGGPEHG